MSGRERSAKVRDISFAEEPTLSEKIKNMPPWYWIVIALLLAGAGVLGGWCFPEIALAAAQERMEQNFCTIQAGSDEETGCVRVGLQHSPGDVRCVYVKPGVSGSGGKAERQQFVNKYLQASEVSCYYPVGEPDLISFSAPDSHFEAVYVSFGVSLILFLSGYLVAYTCIKLSPSKDDMHDPEIAYGLISDMEARVNRQMKQQLVDLKQNIATVGAKVDRDQDKRVQMMNDIVDMKQRQRGEIDELRYEVKNDGRRMIENMETQLQASNNVLESVQRKAKARAARGGDLGKPVSQRNAGKRGLRAAASNPRDRFKRPSKGMGY